MAVTREKGRYQNASEEQAEIANVGLQLLESLQGALTTPSHVVVLTTPTVHLFNDKATPV